MMKNVQKILIVEDDKYMNETLCDILKDKGYNVDNSDEALDAIDKIKLNDSNYKLLILDYNLKASQNLTGIDVYDEAKKMNPDVKAIMISAYGNRLIKEKALNNGINVYLDKPFLINDLISAVKNLVSIN